jgi:hypothetical protein
MCHPPKMVAPALPSIARPWPSWQPLFFHQASTRRNFKSYNLCQVASSAQTRPSHVKMRRSMSFHGGSRNDTNANASYSIWRRPRMDGRTGWAAAKRTTSHHSFPLTILSLYQLKWNLKESFRLPHSEDMSMPLREGVCAPSHHMNLKWDH